MHRFPLTAKLLWIGIVGTAFVAVPLYLSQCSKSTALSYNLPIPQWPPKYGSMPPITQRYYINDNILCAYKSIKAYKPFYHKIHIRCWDITTGKLKATATKNSPVLHLISIHDIENP